MNQERVDAYLEKYKIIKEKVEIKEVTIDDEEEEGDIIEDDDGVADDEEDTEGFASTDSPFAGLLPDL